MPSMEATRKDVKEKLGKQRDEIDHDAILANLQDEIDRHNAVKDGLRSSMRSPQREDATRDSSRSMRFRFKSGTQEPRTRRSHSSRSETHDSRRSHRKRRRREGDDYPTPPSDEANKAPVEDPAHPFPREPIADPDNPAPQSSDTAFRTSLFDALADDEGAAYWESVYSQPIHIYPRPTVETPRGELEQMSDEEYVEYVKAKMWEKKHPEIVQERKQKDRERRLEEEERTRRREEFVRRRERAAWERAQGWKAKEGDDEGEEDGNAGFEFTGEPNFAPSDRAQERAEYAKAWENYLSAWDSLKYDLLAERSDSSSKETAAHPSKRIPWPVLPSKAVIKPNIEAFMQHAPAEEKRSKTAVLKAERVRWHPDKIQQRFGGVVDEGTMKLVTGIFQVVDNVLENERKRESS